MVPRFESTAKVPVISNRLNQNNPGANIDQVTATLELQSLLLAQYRFMEMRGLGVLSDIHIYGCLLYECCVDVRTSHANSTTTTGGKCLACASRPTTSISHAPRGSTKPTASQRRRPCRSYQTTPSPRGRGPYTGRTVRIVDEISVNWTPKRVEGCS